MREVRHSVASRTTPRYCTEIPLRHSGGVASPRPMQAHRLGDLSAGRLHPTHTQGTIGDWNTAVPASRASYSSTIPTGSQASNPIHRSCNRPPRLSTQPHAARRAGEHTAGQDATHDALWQQIQANSKLFHSADETELIMTCIFDSETHASGNWASACSPWMR